MGNFQTIWKNLIMQRHKNCKLAIFFKENFHFFQGHDAPIRGEDLSPDTRQILEEVTRFLNMEKLLPCYKFVVTKACLKAIRKLQKTGHLPSKAVIFRDYSSYGQFVDIRLTALECLVDYVRVEGNESDIDHLLSLVENDPVPFVRHKILRMMVDNPPFDKNRAHRNDTHFLVERLWKLMKWVSQCLKITRKIAFNIASETSYVYMFNCIENVKNGQFWRLFEDSVTRQVTFNSTKNGK